MQRAKNLHVLLLRSHAETLASECLYVQTEPQWNLHHLITGCVLHYILRETLMRMVFLLAQVEGMMCCGAPSC